MYWKKLTRNMIRDWQLYIFLSVPLIFVIIFHYIPMLGTQIAFKEFNAKLGIWGSPWVGFYQFEKFIESYQFRRVLVNTLALSFYSVVVTFPIPILFALMMNSLTGSFYKKFAQTIVIMPHFVSTVVLVGILLQVFNSRIGLYGIISEYFTGEYPADLFSSANKFRHMYIWSEVWQTFGWNSIIYIAALSSVDPSLHEAAHMDGASRFQRVCHIDFPSILPTMTVMLILRMGRVMTIGFEKIFLMQNSLNLSASEVISTYIYKVGLSSASIPDFSYSTAIGLFNSVINLILILGVNLVVRRLGETSLW